MAAQTWSHLGIAARTSKHPVVVAFQPTKLDYMPMKTTIKIEAQTHFELEEI